MKVIEMTGKTVEEALNHALNELKLTKDKVDVEIIDEGSKGLFNLIGTKPAKIKVTTKPDSLDDAKTFLVNVLKWIVLCASYFRFHIRDIICFFVSDLLHLV